MDDRSLMVVVAAIPVLAVLFERHLTIPVSERHHSNHDTYTMASTLSRTLVAMMIFVGSLGVVLSWLCAVGAFAADPTTLLSFFAAFLAVAFCLWLGMHRYQVVTFTDRVRVTPFVGRARTILYGNLERMVWLRPNAFGGYRGLRLYERGNARPATVWGTLDVEQILMRINRYDVLEGPAAR